MLYEVTLTCLKSGEMPHEPGMSNDLNPPSLFKANAILFHMVLYSPYTTGPFKYGSIVSKCISPNVGSALERGWRAI